MEELNVENSQYLMVCRRDNLREKIDKTLDEVLELEYLEDVLQEDAFHDSTPSKHLRVLASLEARRVNRKEEVIHQSEFPSHLDEMYAELLTRSWFNPKSIRLITNQGKEVGKEVLKSWNFYKLFPTKKHGSSSCQQIIQRIVDFATSPIYDEMKRIDHGYQLKEGIQLRETDKTFIFSIPFRNFADISPTVSANFLQYISFVEAAFVLPQNAHEKTRYFGKKGACLTNYLDYLDALEIHLLNSTSHLLEKSTIRFYRESFENTKSWDKISGYFLSASNEQSKKCLETMRSEILNNYGKVATVRYVLPGFTWYPSWMRKIGGVVVDPWDDTAVTCLTECERLAREIKNGIFSPSEETQTIDSQTEFVSRYTEEMRHVYKQHPKMFIESAVLYCTQGANECTVRHIDVLDSIFKRVYEEWE